MKRSYLCAPRLAISLVFLFPLLIAANVRGDSLKNSSTECANVLLVFARGSSQNNEHQFLDMPFDDDFEQVEAESAKFFQAASYFLDHNYPSVTYKAQSIHNLPDKYHPRGYPASGIFSIPTVNNAINADISWWPWGDYQDSVQGGKDETVGYVRDEIGRCPDQQIIMGGYSQGAQVIGESLFDFTEAERESIAGVALFGDPKYTGTNLLSNEPHPWKRGTAGMRKQGIAEARNPYVPKDMEYKTVSWCFEDDFVCAGEAAMAKKIIDKSWNGNSLGAGHTRYIYFGINQAAEELLQRISPRLYAVEKSHGGVDVEQGLGQPLPNHPSIKPIDVMFLVGVSAGMDDVVGVLRGVTDDVIYPLTGFFGNVRYGVADISEARQSSVYIPRYNFYQDLKEYIKPSSLIRGSELDRIMKQKLSYGTARSGGGVDRADPLGLAVEKTAMRADWRPGATKHIILFTDRPMKDPYTFNICNQSIWGNLHTWDEPRDPLSCLDAPSITKYSVESHPELCESVWLIITSSECRLNLPQPITNKEITRTIDDSVAVAQSQRVAVTIVVPHEYRRPDHSSDTFDVGRQLEYFAKATGGLFLEHDVFSRPEFSDVMWQVMNHEPKELVLAYQDALDVLDDKEPKQSAKIVQAKVGVPTVFDVSSGRVLADTFRWDFDGDGTWDKETKSPSIEHTFTEPVTEVFMKVSAFMQGEQQTTGNWPLTVEPSEEVIVDDTEVPELPVDISAERLVNGGIRIFWTPVGIKAIITIKDSKTGLPVLLVEEKEGKAILPGGYYADSTFNVLAVNSAGESEPVAIEIKEFETGTVDHTSKLASSESAPWSQFLEEVLGGHLTGRPGEHNYESAGTNNDALEQDEGQVAADVIDVPTAEAQSEVSALAKSIEDENNATRSYIPIMVTVLGVVTGVVMYLILKRLF